MANADSHSHTMSIFFRIEDVMDIVQVQHKTQQLLICTVHRLLLSFFGGLQWFLAFSNKVSLSCVWISVLWDGNRKCRKWKSSAIKYFHPFSVGLGELEKDNVNRIHFGTSNKVTMLE